MSSLADRAGAPSYTPGRRDIGPLLDLLATGTDDEATAIRRALCRRPELAVPEAIARLPAATPDAAARLLRLLGQLAGAPGADQAAIAAALAVALHAEDPGTRRRAAVALGKLGPGHAPIEEALLRRLALGDRIDVDRAVIEALGLTGGLASVQPLEHIEASRPDLREAAQAALVRVRRTLSRPDASAIDPDARPQQPLPLLLHCRRGLESLLTDELATLGHGHGHGPRFAAHGAVPIELSGSMSDLFRARIWTEIGFPVPAAAPHPGPPPASRGEGASVNAASRVEGASMNAGAIAEAITSDEALRVLRSFTRGPVRYRLAFASGGHRRGEVRAIARAVAARAPDLVNDPTRTDWEVLVDDGGLELRPRGLVDPRFAYRVADVPAASHPTIAAALARVAFQHAPDPAADLVWDPFCGSGLELIERARLGPSRRLVGSDVSAEALEAARANLASAGVAAELIQADALEGRIGRVTTIITNPPMGRRVARGHSVELLERFVVLAGEVLGPGGRLVWIAPSPRRTDGPAAAAGLLPHSRTPVDMGGFTAELQVLLKGQKR